MTKSEIQTDITVRTWLFTRNILLRLSLLNLLLVCSLPIFITGFVFFWSIPQIKRFERGNIKDFMEIAGAEIALVALLQTAFSVNSEYHRQRKLRSSSLIERWHSSEIERSKKDVRLLQSFLNKKNFRLQEIEKEIKVFWAENRGKQIEQTLNRRDELLSERAKIFNSIEDIFVGINEEKLAEEIVDPMKITSKNKEEKEKVPPLRDSFNNILNFFEQMGQEVKFGIADEYLLRDFFYYIVVQNYADLGCLLNMARWRKVRNSPEYFLLFANFEYLASRWMKQGSPPSPYRRFGHILAKGRRSSHSLKLADSKLEIQITPQKTEFEELLMKKLLDGENQILANLRDQYYCHSIVQLREESGAGFFLNFKVENPLRVEPKKFQIDDVYFDLEDVSFGGGAILFVEDGALSYLEVYLHTDEWVRRYKIFESKVVAVYYDTGKNRDLEKQSEKWFSCNS